jgi:hypothetical protein
VAGLLEVFVDVNKKFVSATVEGALMMVGGSVNLAALQASTADSRVDILPAERDVRRVTRVVSQKWWRSFGYNFVLAAIQARLHGVNVHVQCV